ncbi:hypothetical protein Desdi_0157 [Desulfitobacterium dichloroeliminans LMG P-21439]|uniref:Telomeric repeat-binding factor 2 n=1 Tax=Desulfitobacterium dichloroeliminans (strain LMG P-21439 / DCA1) TaxID=871963 RepID=L0F3G4_DESDL|nr:hypothetical protein [Desulfitobacterium dichloroeliminans]AGA67717.1 hypothetical protein Desdi_0157 [Desulfitobacterium dichloroeliminans LMG P-21439]
MKGFPTKVILSIVASIALLAGGCTGSTKTGQDSALSPNPSLEGREVEVYSQTLDLNEIVDMETMKLRIINVSLVRNTDPSEDAPLGKIALGIEIGNTSEIDQILYPEDWEMTIDSGEITKPDLTLTSSLGGTYPPARVQQGFITFPVNEKEITTVKELSLKIPYKINEEGAPGTKEFTISLDELKS